SPRARLPPGSGRRAGAGRLARATFRSWGYAEIRTPVLEDTELFARSVGETTDIVHKEMYTFQDRKGRSLTLRPENTAGVVRALVEKGIQDIPKPIRLWYAGPQFRYEQPQAGRYREFRQLGVRFVESAGIVRGIDYYTLTVFEVASERLGAQNAILGGGRYDGLVADLGGPATPAIGFAIGEDRLVEAMTADVRPARTLFA